MAYQQNAGMGNRQPVKQFKPSPRVGMNANNGPQTAGMVRPGTGGGMISSGNNTMNFK